MVLRLIFFAIAVASCSTAGFAQSAAISPNYLLSTSIRQASNALIEEQQAIFSGPNYNQYFTKLSSQGHPYFKEMKGLYIEYNDIEYRNITFLYDTYLNEIVVLRPDQKNWVTLRKTLVSQFNLGGHVFQNFQNQAGLESGFYEVLVNTSKAQLLAKWSKAFRASSWNEHVELYAINKKPYLVNNRKQLLTVFSDKQAEVKQFIKENRLKFGQNKIEDFSKVVRYYSSITN
jgi:hypothetical protein